MKNLTKSALDQIVANTAAKKRIHGAAFRIERVDDALALSSAASPSILFQTLIRILNRL